MTITKQIRIGTFETNSSSTHTMVIGTKQQVQDWRDGKLVLQDRKFIETPENLEKENDGISRWDDYYCFTAEDYFDWMHEDVCLETDENDFTTPGGEELTIICAYGYDG